ncbi:hypothetical protein SQ11_12875 [Nitrosospira sp. NpAV]|nr:hypothetical protein SQ11_12875 [Nitrosospira sp. NpAV]
MLPMNDTRGFRAPAKAAPEVLEALNPQYITQAPPRLGGILQVSLSALKMRGSRASPTIFSFRELP